MLERNSTEIRPENDFTHVSPISHDEESGELRDELPPDVVCTKNGREFIIEKKIGQGGMGITYLANEPLNYLASDGTKRTVDYRPVVIKIIRPEYSKETLIQQRFKLEKEALIKASENPYVVNLLDVGQLESGEEAIVMEYLPDGDLDSFLKKNQLHLNMSESYIADIAKQICYALSTIHDKGFIHRDLKPDNVLVSGGSKTSPPHIKITDFGVAGILLADTRNKKKISSPTFIPRKTSNFLLGTPGFMAPELLDFKPIDHRVDLYSLGVLLYEMTTGHLPYDKYGTQKEAMAATVDMKKPPEAIETVLGQSKPTKLQQIIMHLLRKNPDRRSTYLVFRPENGERQDKILPMYTALDVAKAIEYAVSSSTP